MKIKVGFKWKNYDGKEYTIREITADDVFYENKATKKIYSNDRKHFEKYMKLVSKFWNNKTKDYKKDKENLRRNEV